MYDTFDKYCAGDMSALEAFARLKQMEKDLKDMLNEVEPDALHEAASYPENTFCNGVYTFEKRKGGANYNFKVIPEWVAKKEELTEIENKAKAAFKASILNVTGISVDGEVIDLPEVTYKKDSLILKQ